MRGAAAELDVGEVISPRELEAITGQKVQVPDAERLVHLQFRRFAGCPFCNLHLRSIEERHDEIVAAGIREIVVFHSSAEALLAHEPDHSFAIVPDPEKRLYAEFGVRSSVRSELDPRMWPTVARGIAAKARTLFTRRTLDLDVHGGVLGLPADFLIAPDGEVIARKYGEYAYDQWSVEELLALVPELVA
jgi:peroxiredoxin